MSGGGSDGGGPDRLERIWTPHRMAYVRTAVDDEGCPFCAIPSHRDLTDLTTQEAAELMAMTQQALRTIRAVSRPHSFNVGLNLGRSAGGSLADHLHQHVVPRWTGDANFITVVGGTKMLPQLLEDTRRLLADAWSSAS